jgi:hypothetical protein
MIDRRIFFTVVSAVTVSGFIVICTLGQSVHRQRVEAKSSGKAQQLEQVDCIVREYEGKIGIFRGESEKPYKIIDYRVNMLSEYDREQIQEGIVINSEDELKTFIEDIST